MILEILLKLVFGLFDMIINLIPDMSAIDPLSEFAVDFTGFIDLLAMGFIFFPYKLFWCFVGLPGAGKTMSLVHYLDDQRLRYGDKIYIITNFYYAGQDEHLSGWDMILKDYDKAVIFAWDELQNEFNSRKYRDFPMQLVHELTQNRKGHGKQVVYTTQTFTAVDNNFRNLTIRVVDCRTYFNRLTKCRHYKREFYEARTESKSIDKKIKLKPIYKETFIQTDFLRSRYDSFQRLDYIKKLNTEDSSSNDTTK